MNILFNFKVAKKEHNIKSLQLENQDINTKYKNLSKELSQLKAKYSDYYENSMDIVS